MLIGQLNNEPLNKSDFYNEIFIFLLNEIENYHEQYTMSFRLELIYI